VVRLKIEDADCYKYERIIRSFYAALLRYVYTQKRRSTLPFTIKENISWVGKVDWELRAFHGQEYSTHRGSSYNSYLVRDKKIALIDTVWGTFSHEFVARLKKRDLT